MIRNGVYAVYHAGDSRRVQGMAEAVAPHGVDIAFVPINGQNGNMDGTDAARLAYETGTQIAVACHHEMFRNDTASTSRFVAECVRLRVEYRLPRVGERITIDYGVLSRGAACASPDGRRSAGGPAVVEHDRRAGERATPGAEQERRHIGDLGRLDQALDRLRGEQDILERLLRG